MSRKSARIHDSQLHYKKHLGQNFLYDETLVQQLVDLSGVDSASQVLEVGPGAGTMTRLLCRKAARVLAVELDERLIPLLQASVPAPNLTLCQGDILSLPPETVLSHLSAPIHVVANIPYYITTPLIQRLLTWDIPTASLSLMVQREVAEKVISQPGEEGWGMLALLCQYYTRPEIGMDIPAEYFTPRPKVDSSFLLMPVRPAPAVEPVDEKLFFRVAAAGFALRRKTMANALQASFPLSRNDAVEVLTHSGVDPKVRGEKLTMEELAQVTARMAGFLSSRSHE